MRGDSMIEHLSYPGKRTSEELEKQAGGVA
jgi:hypothetical protein